MSGARPVSFVRGSNECRRDLNSQLYSKRKLCSGHGFLLLIETCHSLSSISCLACGHTVALHNLSRAATPDPASR